MELSHQRLRRLLEPIHDRALGFARSVSRSRDDGDDLFQESLLRALDKLPSLREDGAFRGWLYRIIINLHRNRSRRAFWKRLIPLVGNEVGDNRAHDETLGSVERARIALEKLPADQREAIVLHDIEGWAVGEIADLEGVSMSAIKSRLSRGRERLRDIYGRRFGVRESFVTGEETP
ncbi:MAG: RNA polymerase sigma factor [Myxococcota bacterium]|nr:RNA polymerase sigma factor [Myxococcota bacterium]